MVTRWNREAAKVLELARSGKCSRDDDQEDDVCDRDGCINVADDSAREGETFAFGVGFPKLLKLAEGDVPADDPRWPTEEACDEGDDTESFC